jgi:nucleotide-binding universal stress UspA family protein
MARRHKGKAKWSLILSKEQSMSEKRRLLIALDGSEQSFEVVRYASKVLAPGKMKVVLFHVQSKIPESFWDIEKNPSFRHRLAPVAAWAMQQEKAMDEFMERSRQVLVDQGVPPEAVDVKIQDREVGIARDIAREAQKDYDAVVVGRWGMSKIKDLVWGSIANKVVGHLVQSPLWVVGGSPQPGKYLVAMDGSDEAMRAVDYVGTMLAGSDCAVTLFHVLRGFDFLSLGFEGDFVPTPEILGGEEIKAEFQRAEEAMKSVFNQAQDTLEKAGLKGDQINSKIVTGAASRAKAIVEEAKNQGYGTIVVGRRGLSRVEEFFMGRVSSKVMQLAKEMAVWVVG